ncbi:hypothetical protein SAMN05892883_0092 [Jatrophihabitans sp. GAS493]|nr:hypothetical protein SAMN05892883_0092 [Jatrophihabitans sp. GAS493]
MWEVAAAEGHLSELFEFVRGNAAPSAQIYRSAQGHGRVVVIDPTGAGITDVPPEWIARPPHAWPFEGPFEPVQPR